MQLLAALILLGLFVLILGAAIYFGSHQKPRAQHYGSWSRVLGPQFNGSAMDVKEKLNAEIAAGQNQSRRMQRTHSKRSR